VVRAASCGVVGDHRCGRLDFGRSGRALVENSYTFNLS
jgi:hypothetical protein